MEISPVIAVYQIEKLSIDSKSTRKPSENEIVPEVGRLVPVLLQHDIVNHNLARSGFRT